MFYYTDPFRFNKSGDMQLFADIAKAINGEYSAIICYEQLAKLAPTEEARTQILEIRQDEIRHYQTFSHIYITLTGKQYTPQVIEPCATTYTEGLRASFKGEQETADFYLDIADNTTDPYTKEQFRRASSDEQNHAVWFLYFLTDSKISLDRQPEPANYGAKGALQATTLTLSSMLTYALQDEYLSLATYDAVIEAFGDVPTFVRIKEAEQRHIDALLPLFQTYNTPIPPQHMADMFVSTPETIKMAYALGVQGEIDNIEMYERFLTYEIPADVRTVFTRLRDASRHHLAAFEQGLARE